MTSAGRRLALAAAAGSALTLAAALWFQFVEGLAPCPMCIWQRWPHVAAVAAGAAAAWSGVRLLSAASAVAMVAGAGLGLFHVGVEQKWWEGPSTCVAGSVEGLTADELLAQIMAAPMVRCDEIAWQFLGVSMAGWNAILCVGLGALFAAAYASSSASQYR
jgi:disulfide bond formation protein DsbB